MLIDPETRPGLSLYPGATRLTQGIYYQYTRRGHFLILSVERPVKGEIAAVEAGIGHFGLFFQDQVLFLLSQFGPGPCRAAHYNWWFNPPDWRPDIRIALADDQPRLNLQTILVDAGSGVILTNRSYCIAPPFSRYMLTQISVQIGAEFDPRQHLDTVAEVLARYPDRREMLFNAVATCTFGHGIARGQKQEKKLKRQPQPGL
jgi:hypothetical protein